MNEQVPIECAIPAGWKAVAVRAAKKGEHFLFYGSVETYPGECTLERVILERVEWVPEDGDEVFQVDIETVELYRYEPEDGSNYWKTDAAARKARAAAEALWATLDHETGLPKEDGR